jgi:hypothetical protein
VQLISLSAYQPSLKQIEFAAAVHLPSDELEAGDLPLGLSHSGFMAYRRKSKSALMAG